MLVLNNRYYRLKEVYDEGTVMVDRKGIIDRSYGRDQIKIKKLIVEVLRIIF